VEVHGQIADEESLARPVLSGGVNARPERGHVVHAEVAGLRSNQWYWYQFTEVNAVSRQGRTRKRPPATAPPSVSRSPSFPDSIESAVFPAFDQLAREKIDLTVHPGDPIYERARLVVESGRPKLLPA